MSMDSQPESTPKEFQFPNGDFQPLYQEVINLPSDKQYEFLIHDYQNLIAQVPFCLFQAGILEEENLYDLYDQLAKKIKDLTKKPATFLQQTNKKELVVTASHLIEGVKQKLEPYFDQLAKINEKSKENIHGARAKIIAIKKFIPILENSIDFLEKPTSENFNKLETEKISLKELYRITANNQTNDFADKIQKIPDIKVDGSEAIIFFNLFKNAQRYTSKNKPLFEVKKNKNGNIQVINYSNNSLIENFGLGKKGIEGQNGYGLYIATLMAAKKGLKIIPEQNKLANQNYMISFTVVLPV